jgi:hypothetical protein
MVELRWAVPAETTTKAPRLQYRQCSPVISFGAGTGWSEWQDVPWVVVPEEAPKPAPTALAAPGVAPSPAPDTRKPWDKTSWTCARARVDHQGMRCPEDKCADCPNRTDGVEGRKP